MFEERPDIQARLDEELVIWLTTVNTAGQPQTSPVWFLVEDESIVVYSLRADAAHPEHRGQPAGLAEPQQHARPAARSSSSRAGRSHRRWPARRRGRDYVTKYETAMEDLGMTPESFAADYPVRIHVQPTRLRAS